MSESKLFRQKSIDKISSPEQLDDYINVISPKVWMLLVSVILVLAGMVICGTFGELQTRLVVPAIVSNGEAALYVEASEIMRVRSGQDVDIDIYSGKVISVGNKGENAGKVLGSIAMSEAGYEDNDVVYDVKAATDAPDGIYMAEVVVDSISPMSFLINDEQ